MVEPFKFIFQRVNISDLDKEPYVAEYIPQLMSKYHTNELWLGLFAFAVANGLRKFWFDSQEMKEAVRVKEA